MIKIGKNLSRWTTYSCQPTTKGELRDIVEDRISKEGLNCDLNDIDVSQITDMSRLFYYSKLNGNISRWDVSNVEKMNSMFNSSKFNGNISNWDVSNVNNMEYMFYKSEFNSEI